MGGSKSVNTSIQAYLTAVPSPIKNSTVGDGFTPEEVQEALKPIAAETWHPEFEYADQEISDLAPGPAAVTFMGRVANIFDVTNSPKTPRSAKGCIKFCVKDSHGAITVRLWHASRMPRIRLGSLVSIWTNHISNGENGTLSSASAPLFASLFPERDRNCHIMVHDNSLSTTYRIPLGYQEGVPLNGLMTLQNFIESGYEVVDAKILVVVKSIGARKKVTRKDGTTTENINLQVTDNTAEATFGLWGTSSRSPAGLQIVDGNAEATSATDSWKPGETVLLLQGPGWKIGRTTYLSLTASTIVDVDPDIPDANWLRRWSLRQKSKEAINPAFPEGVFEANLVEHGEVRCLFTIADLDQFARCSPHETFQGYLSLIIMEFKLLEYWKRRMLFSAECCNIPTYANAFSITCKGCDKDVQLRLNPRIMGQVIDETAAITGGKLLFSDQAWHELLGRAPEELLRLSYEEIKYLADRILFCRITALFGWTGDESRAGGRICVLGVRS